MDKISKRSKGYAFVEYTTEEAAGAALQEMNGKVDPNLNFLLSYQWKILILGMFQTFASFIMVADH